MVNHCVCRKYCRLLISFTSLRFRTKLASMASISCEGSSGSMRISAVRNDALAAAARALTPAVLMPLKPKLRC